MKPPCSLTSLYTIVTIFSLACVPIDTARANCDVRIALQNDKFTYTDFSRFGLNNRAIVIGGYALKAGGSETLDSFLAASPEEIQASLEKYVRANKKLTPEDLVILDLEPGVRVDKSLTNIPKFDLKSLGNLDHSLMVRLISAYKTRVDIARKTLKKNPLGLYGVIVPHSRGFYGNKRVIERRMRGYMQAGKLGLYDGLDFLVPVVYPRFGPSDHFKYQDWKSFLISSSRQAIEYSSKLRKSDNRTKIPLAPLATFWVFNGKNYTSHYRQKIPKESLAFQVSFLFSFPSVSMVVLWVPRSDLATVEDIDFANYFKVLNEKLSIDCVMGTSKNIAFPAQ